MNWLDLVLQILGAIIQIVLNHPATASFLKADSPDMNVVKARKKLEKIADTLNPPQTIKEI